MDDLEWLQKCRPEWMNDDQFACFVMACELFHGEHHLPGKVKECGPRGIEINGRYGCHMATFDYDQLTRAVFMAHDRCIRFEVLPSGPGMLRLHFHRRHKREGQMHERHPTLENALAKWREHNPLEERPTAKSEGAQG